MTTNNYAGNGPEPQAFRVDRYDAAECRRLRLTPHLNSDAMAEVEQLPDRWAWMSIESGDKPMHPGCWVLCLLALGAHPDFQMKVGDGPELNGT